MDDLSQQQTMDLNPMMSLVGGDFNNQAAAAAAAVAASNASAAAAAAAACAASSAAVALGVQPTLLATNASDIYGLAHMGGLHQQLLQQSAAAVFQNYAAMEDDDGTTNLNNAYNAAAAAGGILVNSSGKPITTTQFLTTDDGQQHHLQQHHNQQIYDQMDDGYEDGISGLTPKQEIINIDDFVMMTDSNSYDGTDFINSDDKSASGIDITQPHEVDDHDLLVPMSDEHKILSEAAAAANRNILAAAQIASTSANSLSSRVGVGGGGGGVGSNNQSGSGGGNLRSQRKTRKIEPVNRPGLVLKTPIAYKGNIDPSVIPIQKDGMAVCERCGQ
ncbi:hypothetical protein DOY81_010658 [Sarcophaga bullata]|nr:hypothetical protein DOY81_010658 [Sarcophaga bullata]